MQVWEKSKLRLLFIYDLKNACFVYNFMGNGAQPLSIKVRFLHIITRVEDARQRF